MNEAGRFYVVLVCTLNELAATAIYIRGLQVAGCNGRCLVETSQLVLVTRNGKK